jgi:DNA-directed RNA polymerase specialized sigma24 family protein
MNLLQAWIRAAECPYKAYAAQGIFPRTLDLFEVTLIVPTPWSEPAPALAELWELASLSDAQLAKHLGQLMDELQRRMETGRGSRPELKAAVRKVSVFLERLSPRPSKQRGQSSRSGKSSSTLQEGQRKAVRAALLAGVMPAQVAKHFGLPLAAVRKVLEETA